MHNIIGLWLCRVMKKFDLDLTVFIPKVDACSHNIIIFQLMNSCSRVQVLFGRGHSSNYVKKEGKKRRRSLTEYVRAARKWR